MYYFPIMSLTPVYFDRHRGFAMGFVLSGAGFGGLVFAPVLRHLLDHVGIHWALRILGIWNLVVGLPVASVVRQRPGFGARAPSRSARVNMKLVTKGTFLWQVLCFVLTPAIYVLI
jgi:MFS family permease